LTAAILLGLLGEGASFATLAGAAERCVECVTAGAASVPLRLPAGVPLAGYGSLKRRLLVPDVLGRYPHAFWFTPSVGELDPLAARALVIEDRDSRLAWVTLDLIGVDHAFTRAVQERLAQAGAPRAALIVSASHTHSGPGAFMDSAVMGVVAVDRLDPAVRTALVEAAVTAIRRADAARAPALAGAATVPAPPVTESRLARPLDPEIVVVKLTTTAGAPIALVWNFAIHGTMLSAGNRRLSGDVMGIASAELERKLGVPTLFVNGAVGDVSPSRHGAAALRDTAAALVTAVEAGWTRATPTPVTSLRLAQTEVALPPPAFSLKRCVGRWVPGEISLGSSLPARTELTAAALGNIAWVTIPGELQTSFGQAIKREGRARFSPVFVAGLSNDYLGYFTTPEDATRRAYVACATVYGPDAGGCLTDAAIELLHRLGEPPPAATRPPTGCGGGPPSRR
jgi:neutral ceramidase